MKKGKRVAEAILDQLASWGVKRIYGFAGDAILEFIDAINNHPQIEYISTRHEAAAAFMASAESKLTGRIGVCTATCGPGLANLLNGLADAYLDKAPVLAITGQVDTKHIGTNYKQYIDEQVLIQPIAKYSTLLIDGQATSDIVYKALQISLGQGAVTHIAVPKDVFAQAALCQPRARDIIFTADSNPQEEGINRGVEIIANAKKPMLLVGRGAKGKGHLVEELANLLAAAITYSLPAKCVVNSDHQYLVGGLGHGGSHGTSELLKQTDCLITIGSTWWPEKFVPQQVPIIQVDGVIENIGIQGQITLGIQGCITKTLELWLAGLKSKKIDKNWVKTIKTTREKWLEELTRHINNENKPISPARLVHSVEKVIQKDAIITLDVGDHVLWFNKVFRGQNQDILISGSWRSMGFGLPAALSAKLEYPDRQVIALLGDGGLTMSMGELIVAKERGIAVKVIVFNNKSLAMEKNKMIVSGLSQTGTNILNPDFNQVALACGWESYKVKNIRDLDDTIKKALESNRPALVDVEVDAPIPDHTSM
jgi:pyruvate oxidase